MKEIFCPRCNVVYGTGNFCTKCGSTLSTRITAHVEFKPIETVRHVEELKRDAKQWLSRIGVTEIEFITYNNEVTVNYTLGSKKFSFKSIKQKNTACNLAAVEQFLHYRVLGIERGIETSEQAFAGYVAIEHTSKDYFAGCITIAEVDKRYRDLSKQLHPDVNNGHNEMFVELGKQLEKIKLKLG